MATNQPVTRGRRGVRRTIRLAIAALGLALLFSACSPQQTQLLTLTNRARANAGVRGVSQNLALTIKAQGWAEHMARTGHLSHSNLASGVPYRYRLLGENVGYGSTVTGVFNNLMRSPGHRANILNSRFNYIGLGVAYGHGHVWVVQVFMQY